MTLAAKLHILLITTILGVGLYMFLLYKEIKLFDKELADIRVKIQHLAAQVQGTTTQTPSLVVTGTACPMSLKQDIPSPPTISQLLPEIPVVADNLDDPEEDMSVTSNEIKEILTSINDTQIEVPAEKEEMKHLKGAKGVKATSKAVAFDIEKWSELTDDELQSLKYDELRAILSKYGITKRGTKQELVTQLLSIKAAGSATNDTA